MSNRNRQHGGSALGTIVTLAIIAYGVFFAVQYVPQYLESTQVDSILETVADAHRKKPMADPDEVRSAIAAQLYINQMDGLKDSFTVKRTGGGYTVNVRYERDLNLLFTTRPRIYEKTLKLD